MIKYPIVVDCDNEVLTSFVAELAEARQYNHITHKQWVVFSDDGVNLDQVRLLCREAELNALAVVEDIVNLMLDLVDN